MTTLADLKAFLRLTHDEDDALLTRLLGSATREALAWMDDDRLPDVPGPAVEMDIPEDVLQGIFLLVQADYDGDPVKRESYRKAATALLRPYSKVL
ncbi:head-tail connector protein [Thauera sp. WH-1]|uniref:head-tail connector protein n=1 Tax=Thauera sp. WH-1 TaxID=3398230 RepID=UPI0039FD08B8